MNRERIGILKRQRDDIDSTLAELRGNCAQITRLLAEKGVPADEV